MSLGVVWWRRRRRLWRRRRRRLQHWLWARRVHVVIGRDAAHSSWSGRRHQWWRGQRRAGHFDLRQPNRVLHLVMLDAHAAKQIRQLVGVLFLALEDSLEQTPGRRI